MPTDDGPSDDEIRMTHNFAPGYFGLVYRADLPDYGAGGRRQASSQEEQEQAGEEKEHEQQTTAQTAPEVETTKSEPKYKLQAMKWGEYSSRPRVWFRD